MHQHLSQHPLEPAARLAHYYSLHPEQHHADRAAEREPGPLVAPRPRLVTRARRAVVRVQRAAAAARRSWAVSGRVPL